MVRPWSVSESLASALSALVEPALSALVEPVCRLLELVWWELAVAGSSGLAPRSLVPVSSAPASLELGLVAPPWSAPVSLELGLAVPQSLVPALAPESVLVLALESLELGLAVPQSSVPVWATESVLASVPEWAQDPVRR